MRLPKYSFYLFVLAVAAFGLTACHENENANTTSVTGTPGVQTLTVVPRPQKIDDLMKARGEQDEASPSLSIVTPARGATINGSTVAVKLELSGELKGYVPHKDPATGKGNHIHVILDNQPYEAYYELNQPFELRNVAEGKHTLRVFPSRPWHESFKNEGAFQIVEFTVKGGSDLSKPTTTNNGQMMASPGKSPAAKSEASKAAAANASPAPAGEGKDVAPSSAGNVDATKPLLTYSRPKGEYKAEDADPIMIDFWLSNAKLQSDGGNYRVRYTVDGGEARFIDTWKPIWLSGWLSGKHTVKLELVDKSGNAVDNGGYNATTREITVVK